ncbi:UDP-3-O-[3-hydroxymyristoyl] N-acetylglucosamine deacetylase [Helicobacter monodelphidis]|uniref:UDP-3-O-acyl-N-acetylglucosamine deacetylase n=1 Tax=Helicobacter sp. 15-1451 TaxID=2004995 RepID=UPI000DCE0104|nr:UDP-3-O-acyl-N-acetylglucosamine deacetylase [Helicobacter sp. 15-1451]RAX58053.1 UDP-3-O-[3-hydroxymyristoyl] N-acetylglucosamine deacetylase [Helicobacter sp. 15-1451]
MKQKTIQKNVDLVGIGLHKGVPVRLKLEPAPENSGLVFTRSDLGVSFKLTPECVIDTTMATVVGKDNARISTIEHFLSAVYAYGIDNLHISVDNEEMPIMDGSSISFCMLLDEAGIVPQNEPKKVMKIKETIEVKEGDKFVRITPSDKSLFDFEIDFKHPAIAKQAYQFYFSTTAYKEEIAKARTFGFLHEVQYLRSKGLALGGSLANAIVLDETKILNPEGLRYKEEFVRHKILDAIGDMALLGVPLFGSYVSYAGSHKLNHLLTKQILGNPNAYEIVTLNEEDTQSLAIEKIFALDSCKD